MKKTIITLLFASTLFVACEDIDTANVSTITEYPTITLLGDEVIYVPLGTPYEDPGAIAMEGPEEIPTVKTYSGIYRGGKTIDTNVMDQYTETYTAVNKDGYKASKSRTVIVYQNGNLVNSIEGMYISTVTRNGNYLPASQGSSVDMKYIYIWKNTDGTYQLSDAFGGWYSLGRKLGVGYATPDGTINAIDIPTNSFTFPGNPLSNSGFGGVANIIEMSVNPTAKQVVFTTTWVAPGTPPTNYTFVTTLTQFQP